MRSVAATEAVPLIDLTARSRAVVEGLGPEQAKALYLTREKRDDTHTSEYGRLSMPAWSQPGSTSSA
jgi:hypothetical protein